MYDPRYLGVDAGGTRQFNNGKCCLTPGARLNDAKSGQALRTMGYEEFTNERCDERYNEHGARSLGNDERYNDENTHCAVTDHDHAACPGCKHQGDFVSTCYVLKQATYWDGKYSNCIFRSIAARSRNAVMVSKILMSMRAFYQRNLVLWPAGGEFQVRS